VVEHQRLNKALVELRRAVIREDARISQLAAALRDAETLLQDALDEATPRLSALENSNKRPVDVDEVIAYATKVGASLAAPPGWDPSKPLGNHMPPAPSEDMMRAGRLANLSGGHTDQLEVEIAPP
jgi:Vitamin-D-receptor interacting Mediator subunit 4